MQCWNWYEDVRDLHRRRPVHNLQRPIHSTPWEKRMCSSYWELRSWCLRVYCLNWRRRSYSLGLPWMCSRNVRRQQWRMYRVLRCLWWLWWMWHWLMSYLLWFRSNPFIWWAILSGYFWSLRCWARKLCYWPIYRTVCLLAMQSSFLLWLERRHK